MNQLRVANKQERILFEQTIQTDLTKIPNINQNIYGVQKFTPLIPNNPHNNQYGSDYKKNYDNNLGYNKILPNENYPNYNQPSNFIGLDNNNPFNKHSNQQGNQYNKFEENKFSNLNIMDDKGENIPGNQTTNSYSKLTFEKNNHNNFSLKQNSKQISKRDVMWDLKRQKTMQGGNNTIMDNFNSKKIFDNQNNLRYDLSSPEVRNTIIKSNPLDNHYNINNNIHSGAPRDIIERTPKINIQNNVSSTNLNQRVTPNNQNNFNNSYNSYYQYNNQNDLKTTDLNRLNGGVQEKIKTPNNIIYTNNGLNNNPYNSYNSNTERRRTPFENNRDYHFSNQPITPQNQYSNSNQNFQNGNIRGFNPNDYQISNQKYINTPLNNINNQVIGGVDVRFNQKQPHSNINKFVNDNYNNSMKVNSSRPFNNLKFNNY